MNRLLYVFLLFLGFSHSLFATDRIWTGATSTNWATASNWSPSGVPVAGDVATINSSSNNPVIGNGSTVDINQLYVNNGATLTINGGGTIYIRGVSGGLGFIGIYGNGQIINNGTFRVEGSGNTAAPVIMDINHHSSVTNNSLMSMNLSVQQSIQFSDQDGVGATFTNSSSGTLTISGNGSGFNVNRDGYRTVINQGTINYNGGGYAIVMALTTGATGSFSFTNSGLININSGSGISVNTSNTFTNQACGKIFMAAGDFNQTAGTTSNSGVLQIDGTLTRSAGTFTNSGVLSYGSISGSITNNSGSVIVNNNPTNTTIFTYQGSFTGTVNGIYTNTGATTLAGTFTAPNTFAPSGLPSGSQTLYAKITPSGGACSYIVPFTYTYTPPPSFSTNPTTKTVCSGTGTTFTVAASDANSYQWQVNTGGGFSTISNSAPYSGATTTTLTISDVTGLSGYQYRCVATGGGGTTNSTAATLTVSPAPSATISYEGSPFCADGAVENVTLAGTAGGTFSALPSGLVLDGNTGQINPVGSTASTYTVTYRIPASNGCSQFTTTASVVVSSSLTVSNPATNTALQGSNVNVSFNATGGTTPRSFSIASGSLPTGLTLATTGVLSGTPTQSGSFSITVRATDANGCSGVGATYSLLVSTTATVTTAAPSSILGTSATLGGNITADGGTSVTERGVVYMTGSGTPTTSNTKVTMGSGTGSFSQAVSNLLSGTTYSVRAYAMNTAGTSYGAVQSFTTISAPDAPVVLTPANGSQLSNNRPTYTGTATPVSSVTVFVDDSNVGEINADAVGNWSFTPSVSLPDGTHRVFARAALNSLTSPNSNTNTFSIDTTPPAAPVITTPANGTTTSDNTPTYAGTAEPLSTVTVRVDGSVIGTPTADASGNWSLTPTTPLADGLYTVRATATDPVGNTGPSSSTITFTIDTTSPTVSITSTAPNPTSTSPIPLTITFSETVSGFLVEDIKFTNGTLSDFAGSGADYTVNVVPGSTGTVSVSVASGAAQDLAGNNNSASNLFSIQYSPMPTISDFSANPDPVCVGNQVTFSANLGNLTGSYTYTLTNGTSTTTGASSNAGFSQLVNTTASGIQTFSLTISNNGQLVTETYDLTVGELPAATLTASHEGALTCDQTSLTLTATGGDDYAFSGPGILSQDPENGIAVINAPGTYSVTVTNTETGCFSTTTTTIISDTATPSVSITPMSITLTCATASVSLTATGGGTYHWDDNSTNAVRTVTTGGTYSVTVTGSNSCTATAATDVSQSSAITSFSVTGSATACAGGQVTLTASGCSGGTIAWPGGITGAVFSTTVSGQYTATCTIGNCTATASGTAAVGNIFTITTPSISTALAGVHMAATLDWSASGGTSPYSFSFSTLPSGLSVVTSSAGFRSIGGTPTQTGTFPISVTVTDNLGCAQVAAPYSLTVNCPTLTLTTPSISTALVGVHMAATLDWSASGGTSPYSFSFSTLPSGLSVVTSSAGFRSIGGTPTQTGTFPISVTVTDNLGCSQVAAPFSLTVNCPTLTLTTPSISTALAGVHMVNTLDWSASGGTSPYSFSFSTLPSGLSVVTSSAGFRSIGGTPTQTGTFPISVTVTDNLGCAQVAAPFSLTVNCPTLTLTTPSISTALVGVHMAATLDWSASGGSSPYSFSFSALPSGLSVVTSSAGFRSIGGTPTQTGTFPISVTVTDNLGCAQVAAPYSLTVNCPTLTASITPTPSATLTCAQTSLTLTASGGSSYTFAGPGIVSQNASLGTAVVNTSGTYSVTLTNVAGCTATTTTTISSNTVLTIATGASLPMANVGVVVSLTASGATSYQWSAPSTASLTTPATSSAVSVSLTTAGVQTFTVIATAGVCSQSALVSVTALAGPDLSAIMSLPDGNFSAGESKGLLVQVQEVNGSASSGNIAITITVPTGYSISFDNTLTSINVSGGETNPVAVQNSKWHVSNTVAGQQLSLAINGGESVGANSTLNLGFTITRTTANAGSTSNITVNVADDGEGTYDVNRLNNIYARIINGL